MHGLLDRLASPLDLDAYLAAVNPRWGTRLRGVVERVDAQTATAASIVIRPGPAWRPHRAGQFVTVGVDVDGVRHQRCYSLTSSPTRADGRIEITVQALDGGTVSTHLVERTRPGDVVHLSQADGDFTLPTALPPTAVPPSPLLFVSGGSGITPLMGMLRTIAALDDDPNRLDQPGVDQPSVVLIHHAASADRVLFAAELTHLAATTSWLDVEVVLTRDADGCSRPGAHLDAERLALLCPDWMDRDAYVCGPAALLDFATDHWEAHGVTGRLHVERFTPVAPTASAPGTSGTARFARSGVDAPSNGATALLDLAESAGVAAPSGCRMGICHTCSTPVLAGCARDLRDGRLVEAGAHVQLCVSAAAGDITLDL
jgi:ferredoxin-NADP reductase